MCRESDCEEVAECLCPIRGIIEVVSKKWSICIVSLLDGMNPIRYNEIKSRLTEISPKALSDTLKVLEKERLIERRVYPETPPRVEYLLTNDGKALKMALMPLVRWVQQKKDNNLD